MIGTSTLRLALVAVHNSYLLDSRCDFVKIIAWASILLLKKPKCLFSYALTDAQAIRTPSRGAASRHCMLREGCQSCHCVSECF